MKTLKQIREEYNSKYETHGESHEEIMLEAKSKSLMRPDIPSPAKMPTLLLFRRMSYRMYPQNQVVALYYSKMINKYLSIPFGPDGNVNLSEASVYDTMEDLDLYEGAKWNAVKGGVKGAIHGIIRGGALGGAVAPGPGTVIGAAIGGIRGAYKGAKKGLESDVKESFRARVAALKEERMDEGIVGDTIEKGRQWAQNKVKGSKTFKAIQDFGHTLPGYENAKAAKEKFSKGDYWGAAKEAGKNIAKAAATGVGVAAAGYLGARALPSLAGAAAGALAGGGKGDAVRGQSKSASTELMRDKPQTTTVSTWRDSSTDPVTKSRLKGAELRQAKAVKENKISDIKKMISENIAHIDMNINGKSITLNNNMAKRIVEVYDSVNTKNKKIVESMLNEDLESFKKLLNFSIRK